MHANDQHLFVLAAIENADAAALGQAACRAPQEIVIEFEARRLLETEDLATGRIDALHDRSNRAVLAGGVHRLEDQQHRMTVAGGENPLQLIQIFGPARTMFALVAMPIGLR